MTVAETTVDVMHKLPWNDSKSVSCRGCVPSVSPFDGTVDRVRVEGGAPCRVDQSPAWSAPTVGALRVLFNFVRQMIGDDKQMTIVVMLKMRFISAPGFPPRTERHASFAPFVNGRLNIFAKSTRAVLFAHSRKLAEKYRH
ncbi:hypothetical protein ACV229_30340 [Burkholderia sp. MR1-5-21]